MQSTLTAPNFPASCQLVKFLQAICLPVPYNKEVAAIYLGLGNLEHRASRLRLPTNTKASTRRGDMSDLVVKLHDIESCPYPLYS
jgi:hypothetical protein